MLSLGVVAQIMSVLPENHIISAAGGLQPPLPPSLYAYVFRCRHVVSVQCILHINRIVLGEMETVDSLKMRMALRLLIPAVNFHILHNKKELRLVFFNVIRFSENYTQLTDILYFVSSPIKNAVDCMFNKIPVLTYHILKIQPISIQGYNGKRFSRDNGNNQVFPSRSRNLDPVARNSILLALLSKWRTIAFNELKLTSNQKIQQKKGTF